MSNNAKITLKVDKTKWYSLDGFQKFLGVLMIIALFALAIALSYGITAMITWGICMCFGWEWSWIIALGVWLCVVFINMMFNSGKSK